MDGIIDDLLQILLGPFGTLVLSLLILFGGWKRWWVFGWHYSEVAKERDEWKEAALRGTKIAETVTEVLRANGSPS